MYKLIRRVGPGMAVERRIEQVSKKLFLIAAVAVAAFVFAIIRLVDGMASNPPAIASESADLSKQQPPPLDDNSPEVKTLLPLFYRMNDNYTRGSEPLRGGVGVLARLGIKTVVDLRSKYDRTDDVRIAAERIGLAYRWVPMSVWDPPTDEEANQFVALVTDKSQGPFFVFCTDGVNRTGEMSAIYRVVSEGWSVAQAIKEMDERGFSPYYYTLRNYVWTYARKFKPTAVPPSGRKISPLERWEESTKK
jgi:protein tyrosine phosphatase (PTP) superfamily phosphohydrolase (DUF442 family)